MSLLDTLRDRFGGGYDDYEDDYEDDYYDDEEDYDDEPQGSGILGNTSRPEAESVAVYTRSGRPVGTNAGAPAASVSQPRGSVSSSAQSRGSSYTPSHRSRDYDAPAPVYTPQKSSEVSFNASGQLPPYILRAEEYEDVQTVVGRVRTNQPVLLVLNDTPTDTAQRILDFCFGLSFGLGGEVRPVDSKVFLIAPAGISVSESELDRLAALAR